MASTIINGRYELLEHIGTGGMGSVYKAVDLLSKETIALKKLHIGSDIDRDELNIQMTNEFRILASLRHPNIINVLDYGFDDELRPFYTMELLENAQSITEYSRGASLEEKLVSIFESLQALRYLHHRRVIHCDVKPDNIQVVDGHVKLLDFGLALIRTTSGNIEGLTRGTVGYMAPEVLQFGITNETTDLYSLGIVLYEVIMGEHPFSVDNLGLLINEVLTRRPDVSDLDVSVELQGYVARLVEKESDLRYAKVPIALEEFIDASGLNVEYETAKIRQSFLESATFVGRQAELNQVRDGLHAAISGQGSTWLIGGESGVGKSRFIEEVRTAALVEGMLVFRSQATSDATALYQLWSNIFRGVALQAELTPREAGVLKLLVPDISNLLNMEVEALDLSNPQKAQQKLGQTVRSLLQRQQRPLLVILEDLHWSTSDIWMLKQAMSIIEDFPIMILGSYRYDERPDLPNALPSHHHIMLERFTSLEMQDLSISFLGKSLGSEPDLVDLLERETEGNVFFMVEVLRELASRAGQLNNIHEMTLPAQIFPGGIEEIINNRLSQLPESAFPLLRLAAVAGREINVDLLRHFIYGFYVDSWLSQCSAASVLEVQDNVWRFTHDKVRNGVLRQMDAEALRESHQRVALGIETLYPNDESRATELAAHWQVVGNISKELQYTVQAGQQAFYFGAFKDAIEHFERAADLVRQQSEISNEHGDIKFQLARTYQFIGDTRRAHDLFAESLSLSARAQHNRGVANAAYELGVLAYRDKTYHDAVEYLEQSLNTFEQEHNIAGEKKALNLLGGIYIEMGEEDKAVNCYERALNLGG